MNINPTDLTENWKSTVDNTYLKIISFSCIFICLKMHCVNATNKCLKKYTTTRFLLRCHWICFDCMDFCFIHSCTYQPQRYRRVWKNSIHSKSLFYFLACTVPALHSRWMVSDHRIHGSLGLDESPAAGNGTYSHCHDINILSIHFARSLKVIQVKTKISKTLHLNFHQNCSKSNIT